MTNDGKKFLAREIVNRLTDNYEDKGDVIDSFYLLQDLIADSIADGRKCRAIIKMAKVIGVIEEDTEYEA